MTGLAEGARLLPPHHIAIRVPWHDQGWTGTVCARPLDNSSCLVLRHIGERRRDEVEARCASRRLDELDQANLPPCVGERVSFMAPFPLARGIDYAYEQPLVLRNGCTRYPDFTIADDAMGVTFYWEYVGMLDDPGYRTRWEKKRAEYLECGIRPHEEGGGPDGTLIETLDDPGGRLDAAGIASVIDRVILANP